MSKDKGKKQRLDESSVLPSEERPPFHFEGFEYTSATAVPDQVFDELLGELTGNELKVLLYIIRRTCGFGKISDAISLSQFRRGITTQEGKVLDHGCGIEHNRLILVALSSLEEKGIIVSRKRTTKAGDLDATMYKLRTKKSAKEASQEELSVGVVTPGNHVVTPGHYRSYSRSLRWLPGVTTVVTPGNQQHTVLQHTDSQQSGESASADSPESPAVVFSLLGSDSTHAPKNSTLTEQDTLVDAPGSKSDGFGEETHKTTSFSQKDMPVSPQPQRDTSKRGRERDNQNDPKSGGGDDELSPSRSSRRSYSQRVTQPAPEVQPCPPTQTVRTRRAAATRVPDLTPIPPPPRPESLSPGTPITAEKVLEWGNYVRGSELPYSTDKRSGYQKAIWGARRFAGFKVTENSFLLIFVNWMKGLSLDLQPLPPEVLKSPTWPNLTVDIWIAAQHYREEEQKYLAAKQAKENPPPEAPPTSSNGTSRYQQPQQSPPPLHGTVEAPAEWTKQYERAMAAKRAAAIQERGKHG
jgi:hypothetical protein